MQNKFFQTSVLTLGLGLSILSFGDCQTALASCHTDCNAHYNKCEDKCRDKFKSSQDESLFVCINSLCPPLKKACEVKCNLGLKEWFW